MNGKLVIIGYGNPVRGDDALGWEIAQRLQAELNHPDVKIIAAHQLMPEHVEDVSSAELVIFVDAAEEGTPGEMQVSKVVLDPALPPSFTHHISPVLLLSYSRALFGNSPRGWLITVPGICFDCVEALTEPVARAVPVVLQKIREIARPVVPGAFPD